MEDIAQDLRLRLRLRIEEAVRSEEPGAYVAERGQGNGLSVAYFLCAKTCDCAAVHAVFSNDCAGVFKSGGFCWTADRTADRTADWMNRSSRRF